MRIQVAILARVFLGEALGGRQIAAVVIAAFGALIVKLRRPRGRRGWGQPGVPGRPAWFSREAFERYGASGQLARFNSSRRTRRRTASSGSRASSM